MEEFGIVVAIVSFIKPTIMDFIKAMWLNNIQDEQRYKTIVNSLTFAVGVGLCYLINLLGHYEMDTIQIIMVGGGISYTAGQISYRTSRLVKSESSKSN